MNKSFERYNGMAYMWSENRFYYGNDQVDYIDFPHPITGIKQVEDHLIVFTTNAIFKLTHDGTRVSLKAEQVNYTRIFRRSVELPEDMRRDILVNAVVRKFERAGLSTPLCGDLEDGVD